MKHVKSNIHYFEFQLLQRAKCATDRSTFFFQICLDRYGINLCRGQTEFES